MTTTEITVPTGNAYRTGYAAARAASAKADKALATAIKHAKPLTPELHELFLTIPADYAECLRKMADIVASLPQLREDAARATAIADTYAAVACHRCNGTGDYSGATSAIRQGRPYCFYCNGTGHRPVS
jgi:hypothetical protein